MRCGDAHSTAPASWATASPKQHQTHTCLLACAHNLCSPLPAFTQHSCVLPFPFLACLQGMDIRGLVYVGREHLKHVMNGCLRIRDMLGRMQAVAPKPQAVKESPFARVSRGTWCTGSWVKLCASLLASRMKEVRALLCSGTSASTKGRRGRAWGRARARCVATCCNGHDTLHRHSGSR